MTHSAEVVRGIPIEARKVDGRPDPSESPWDWRRLRGLPTSMEPDLPSHAVVVWLMLRTRLV
jgi:hypothetical protein